MVVNRSGQGGVQAKIDVLGQAKQRRVVRELALETLERLVSMIIDTNCCGDLAPPLFRIRCINNRA